MFYTRLLRAMRVSHDVFLANALTWRLLRDSRMVAINLEAAREARLFIAYCKKQQLSEG